MPAGSIAAALRELRKGRGINTQTKASELPGAPDFRTLSHWETGRKDPSLPLLLRYLAALGLDFHALQDAMDQVDGSADQRVVMLAGQVDRLARVAEDIGERRLPVLERRSSRLDEVAAEVERLAGRISALEAHFSPDWGEVGDP